MPKKQIRLNTTDSITEKLPAIYGKCANIVLVTGEVFFARIITSDENKISVSDMRLARNTFEIAQIAEIILDEQA